MTADWIAVDWGSSNLRAWAMDGGRASPAEASPPPAPSRSSREVRAGAPRRSSAPGSPTAPAPTSLICGMAGARGGWEEAPYATVPCPPGPAAFARAPHPRSRASPSASCPACARTAPPTSCAARRPSSPASSPPSPASTASPACPAPTPNGSHLSAGEVVSFASYMTGEIFALLATQSVLRKTLATDGWSAPDFLQAVEDGLARPERMAARLFRAARRGAAARPRARTRPRPPLRPPDRRRARRRPPLLARPRRRPDRRRPPGARLPRRARPRRPQRRASSTPPP